MPSEASGSASLELRAALPVFGAALAAITVPPPGLADLQALLEADLQARLEAEHHGAGLPLSPALAQFPLARLGLDSLGRTEFCIHLELDHGVPLTPDRLAAMQALGELLAFLSGQAQPAGQ